MGEDHGQTPRPLLPVCGTIVSNLSSSSSRLVVVVVIIRKRLGYKIEHTIMSTFIHQEGSNNAFWLQYW